MESYQYRGSSILYWSLNRASVGGNENFQTEILNSYVFFIGDYKEKPYWTAGGITIHSLFQIPKGEMGVISKTVGILVL